MPKPKRRTITIVLDEALAAWFDAECKDRKLSKAKTGAELLRERMDNPPGHMAETVEAEPSDPTAQPENRTTVKFYGAPPMTCNHCQGRKVIPHHTDHRYVPCPVCGVED